VGIPASGTSLGSQPGLTDWQLLTAYLQNNMDMASILETFTSTLASKRPSFDRLSMLKKRQIFYAASPDDLILLKALPEPYLAVVCEKTAADTTLTICNSIAPT
jgi:hypothetical protein